MNRSAEIFRTTYIVDPIVLYDRPADRWVVAGIGDNYAGSYGECVAEVSTTNDPTGSYALDFYSFGGNLNDYDKLSVWATASNSAYLATYNIFDGGQNFAGAAFCAASTAPKYAGGGKFVGRNALPDDSQHGRQLSAIRHGRTDYSGG